MKEIAWLDVRRPKIPSVTAEARIRRRLDGFAEDSFEDDLDLKVASFPPLEPALMDHFSSSALTSKMHGGNNYVDSNNLHSLRDETGIFFIEWTFQYGDVTQSDEISCIRNEFARSG